MTNTRKMNNKIIKNASWIIVCRIAQVILSLFISMITARFLGPSNYGLINYAASIVSFIIPLAQLGINCTLVQEFVEHPNESGKTIGSSLLLTSISSLLGILGILLFVLVVNGNEYDTVLVTILYSISIFFHTTEMIQYWYQSKLLSKYVCIVTLISRIIVSIYKIYIIVVGKSIYWFAIVNSFDFFLITVLLFIFYKILGGQKVCFSFARMREIIRRSKYFALAGIIGAFFTQNDKILLKNLVNDEASGYYSVAISCASVSVFIFTAITDSFRPVILENKKNNESLYIENLKRLYCIIIFLAIGQSLIFIFFSNFFIKILYGAEFLPSVPILRVITWSSLFSYIGNANYIWFLSEKKEKYIILTNGIGAIISVIANLIFIPLFGTIGAAFDLVITQIVTNFILLLIIKPLRKCGFILLQSFNPKILYNMIFNKKSIKGE